MSVASNRAPDNFIERRKYFRMQLKQSLIARMNIAEVKGNVHAFDRKTEVLIQDMSAEGLRIYTYLRLPVTDSIIYEFRTRLMSTDLHVKGIIKREREVRKDIFEYGIQLLIEEADRERLIPLIFKLQRILRNNPLYSDGDFALENPFSYLRKIKHSGLQSNQ